MSDEFVIAGSAFGLSVARGTGEDWTVSTTPTADVLSLAVDGSGRFYAGTADGVQCSDDGAGIWRPCGLEGQRVTAMVSAPGAVFAGAKGPVLYRSDDGGSTRREVESFRHLRRGYWRTPVSGLTLRRRRRPSSSHRPTRG